MTIVAKSHRSLVANFSIFRRRMLTAGLLGMTLILPVRSVPAEPPPVQKATAGPATPAIPLPVPTPPETSPLLTALKQELERSMKRLRLKGYEAPYFISYTLRDIEESEVVGKLGADYGKARDHRRVLHVEVCVGSYELDNTSAGESDGDADLALSLSEISKDAPLDDSLEALRGSLWLLTDQKYKAALASYARKRARGVRDVEPEDKLPSFSKEKPTKFVGEIPRYDVDLEQMSESVRVAGARLKQAPVLDGEIKLNADRVSRYFVSSEGAETIEHRTIFAAHLSAEARAKDGMLLSNERDYYGRSADQLPTAQALATAVDGLVRDLSLLQSAPAADPYNGPAILMEEAAGVFFHETIGHRLEGERQVSE